MSRIPEDSVLRRHYLTEMKYQQDNMLQKFTDHASEICKATTKPMPQSTFITCENLMASFFVVVFLVVVFFA